MFFEFTRRNHILASLHPKTLESICMNLKHDQHPITDANEIIVYLPRGFSTTRL